MTPTKHMVRFKSDDPSSAWNGPVLTRGWFRARRPWREPVSALWFLLLWIRLKKELNRAEGLVSFEYWFRFDLLLFGMHIGWRNEKDEGEFYKHSVAHQQISKWAIQSTLIRAMKLEKMSLDASGKLTKRGGFYMTEHENDIPPDSLFPGIR